MNRIRIVLELEILLLELTSNKLTRSSCYVTSWRCRSCRSEVFFSVWKMQANMNEAEQTKAPDFCE